MKRKNDNQINARFLQDKQKDSRLFTYKGVYTTESYIKG